MIPWKKIKEMQEERDEEFLRQHDDPDCPICKAPLDDHTSCGCFEDVHYG